MKYAPLTSHLSKLRGDTWHATFQDLESVLGRPLPPSAYRYEAWWGNKKGGHPQTEAWIAAGWDVKSVDLRAKKISFIRAAATVNASQPGKRPAFKELRAPAWPWDEQVTLSATLTLTWTPLGRVEVDEKDRLRFPEAPAEPGLYRLHIRKGARLTVYVGESKNLRKRFGNYRRPGPTQKTSARINRTLREALAGGSQISIATATQAEAVPSGGTGAIDLAQKSHRRLFENFALAMSGGIDIESLNL